MYSRLKGLMVENTITQQDLAKILDISISTLNFKINGKSDFTIMEAKKVSKILNKSIEDIFNT
ncbi:helix-turn-helix domain-containing protein [Clostridium botulinum]|uniref:helix-turn-helix transcriptional regulator n=1 Tax=Clostridium botulinum TaxID=1491 RepID=UPI000A175C71|nr:helix-turn-helix domain-containing protein [Clostridium botulinum]MCS6110986.1 helix-turn-helix domain-containing protein [Clostridium botulinum]NFE10720.1 helix-turn-helix domain-containing protein [Clostridium botulinum]NFE95822.1 helix-turn-helix domain-containing protein [Clostridium botulinum]NFL42863.1 helix-turn-helix domain-containing protein [Clostridium botulinum]NFN20508.1 helix-turn-helix domain-containing protein [Clostridium botulinum]